MPPILVEPLSAQAYELLRHLEAMHILRVLKPVAETPAAAPRKWAGALAAVSTTSAEEWDKYLLEIRNEWERDI